MAVMDGFLNSEMRLNYGMPGQVFNVSSMTGCLLLRKKAIAMIAEQELIKASATLMNTLGSKLPSDLT